MDSTELLVAFRSDMVDEVTPYLWSDVDIYRYADAAQKWFCRLTGGIGDATSSLTTISAKAGDEWVKLNPLILLIRAAYRADDGKPIDIQNYENMVEAGTRINSRIGHLTQLILGMEPKKIRLYQIPSEDVVIRLLVDRLPLETIDGAGVDLEVDDQHKDGLLYWMKHLAYLKQDAETSDRAKAAEFEQQFLAYCANARTERDKIKHKPRAVSYGGY